MIKFVEAMGTEKKKNLALSHVSSGTETLVMHVWASSVNRLTSQQLCRHLQGTCSPQSTCVAQNTDDLLLSKACTPLKDAIKRTAGHRQTLHSCSHFWLQNSRQKKKLQPYKERPIFDPMCQILCLGGSFFKRNFKLVLARSELPQGHTSMKYWAASKISLVQIQCAQAPPYSTPSLCKLACPHMLTKTCWEKQGFVKWSELLAWGSVFETNFNFSKSEDLSLSSRCQIALRPFSRSRAPSSSRKGTPRLSSERSQMIPYALRPWTEPYFNAPHSDSIRPLPQEIWRLGPLEVLCSRSHTCNGKCKQSAKSNAFWGCLLTWQNLWHSIDRPHAPRVWFNTHFKLNLSGKMFSDLAPGSNSVCFEVLSQSCCRIQNWCLAKFACAICPRVHFVCLWSPLLLVSPAAAHLWKTMALEAAAASSPR